MTDTLTPVLTAHWDEPDIFTIDGYRRAGDSGDDITLFKGIDTIDVSSVDTNLIGHFYYGDNRSVLSELSTR